MTQANKNANKSFLDKFQGKTNKVGKTGTHAVLTAPKDNKSVAEIPNSNNNTKNQISKDSRATNNQQDVEHQFRKVDLDVLIPSNPQKYYIGKNSDSNNLVKRRGQSLNKNNRSLLKQKPEYVPSAFTPQTTSKDSQTFSSLVPPSRSQSNSTNNSRGKYMFGKYLKLDKQALSHIQFLQVIEQKSFFKRSKGQSLGNV